MGAPEIITDLKITGPVSFAKDRQGFLYVCNGLNKPKVWDGVSETAFNAGIKVEGPCYVGNTGSRNDRGGLARGIFRRGTRMECRLDPLPRFTRIAARD